MLLPARVRFGSARKKPNGGKKMTKTDLMGFVRKSKNGNALKISISTEAFDKAQRYTTQDGQEFVAMVIPLSRVQQILDGYKEVTAVSQIGS